PGLLDFIAIKRAIGCPDNSTILEFIVGLSSEKEQKKARAVLAAHERKAAEMAEPNEAAEETLLYLKRRKLKLGILTRNSLDSVKTALKSFRRVRLEDFSVVITREHDLKLKPHPDGVLAAGRMFGAAPDEMMMVGDYIYDIQAGRKAGALTVFLESAHTAKWPEPPADFTVRRLDELRGIFFDRHKGTKAEGTK
ncbi:MAG: HAD-IA family hydrolase, partial [Kiritimatiellae bacterium]|nr:HAD-IA family hydrolase [Kiritimatiellia bacterium]